MAEGLFDGRYRYDYIYPRGRSGETLRAYDTQHNDRPVVIKRPAPNDAPPIRGGQEVSILNERDALARLSGHPVLTELLDEGHFMAGGTSHRYIVMERGVGVIIEDEVLALAKESQRLPLLETLVIVDNLLDLLDAAHKQDIVYNDVDAKHLFWDRDNYALKAIDWGNAVFLDGEDASPQGVTKQADVFQVGELLYFILTGGKRADIPRDADMAFMVNLGEDAERVPTDLARMLSNALHPNPRLRYASISELRRELTKIRRPLESERDNILSRANERLRRDLSRDELHQLKRDLMPAHNMDPGYPDTQKTLAEVDNRLNDLQIESDLDAARIYLQSANWRGAADILGDLKSGARGETQQVVRLLFDWTMILLDEQPDATDAIEEAIGQVFDGTWTAAALTLVRAGAADPDTQRVHWLLAERVTSHMPEVLLLRPNLFRLRQALASLDGTDGVRLTEQRELLDEIESMLDGMSPDDVSLVDLRDVYRGVVDRLSALTTLMEAVNIGWGERRLPLSSLERARNAAMALADNMHVIGKQAAATPREAMNALDNSRDIDPTNPSWDAVADMLNDLYATLESFQTYVPVADATDLAGWLRRAQNQLKPFSQRLFDEMLNNMLAGLKTAADQWNDYDKFTLSGNRVGTVRALNEAAEAVGTVSPTLSGWFNQRRSQVKKADYVERHALSGGLGRALADGWAAFDDSRLTDADRLASQADQIAKTELHEFVVRRFKTLVETLRTWIERNGVLSLERSEDVLETIGELYTDEENQVRERFNRQMPSRETYLKAMGKGIVEIYAVHSSAAPRILFADYVLQGTIDAHEHAFDDAEFWASAAAQTLDSGDAHIAVETLRGFVQRKRDLIAAEREFNALNSVDAIDQLTETRERFENHPQAKPLAEAARSLKEIENALPDWSNAEFRTAGMKLENAIKAAQAAETAADIDLNGYINWVRDLQATAADLHTAKNRLLEIVEQKPDAPTDELDKLHAQFVDETTAAIGNQYATTLAMWQDTYQSFANVMRDSSMRRSARLDAMSDLFRAMFIDRQPAYPLYRHWHDLTERSSEFPAPPTDDPEPRLADDEDDLPPPIETEDIDADAPARAGRGLQLSRPVIALVVLAVLALGGSGAALLFGGGDDAPPTIAVTISSTPDANSTDSDNGTAVAALGEDATATNTPDDNETATEDVTDDAPLTILGTEVTEPATDAPTDTPTATDTPAVTDTPAATATETLTPTATVTLTPSDTPEPTASPTPTVPADGVIGEVDLLALMSRLPDENPDAVFWNDGRMTPEDEFWRLGVGFETPEDIHALTVPVDVFEQYYGEGAAERVFAVEATLTLQTFNPALLGAEGVVFGAMVTPPESDTPLADGAGLHIDVAQPGVLNIGTRQQGRVNVIVQRSVNAVIVRVRLERTPEGGVIVFFNGERVGNAVQPTGATPGGAFLPGLFVTDGGAILSVSQWRAVLR